MIILFVDWVSLAEHPREALLAKNSCAVHPRAEQSALLPIQKR